MKLCDNPICRNEYETTCLTWNTQRYCSDRCRRLDFDTSQSRCVAIAVRERKGMGSVEPMKRHPSGLPVWPIWAMFGAHMIEVTAILAIVPKWIK